jgi:hypothetical protein
MMENRMDSPQKIKIEKSYDPAVLLLSIYPREIKSLPQRDVYTLMLLEARTWKQPECPSSHEWIKKI